MSARRPLFNAVVAPLAGGPVTPADARTMLDGYRAEVLAEAAEAIDAGKQAFPEVVRNGASWAARMVRRMADAATEKTTPHGAAVTPSVVYRRAEAFVPQTERSYWVAIADALNAAHTAGMPVGVDLDGTLTDRRGWSVVWDAGRWTVAGYEDGDTPAQAPVTPLIVYRASHQVRGEAIPLGWYTTSEAAREHCVAMLSDKYPVHVTVVFDWIGDESEPLDPWELVAAIDGGHRWRPTGYVVTPVEVAAAYDPDAEQ